MCCILKITNLLLVVQASLYQRIYSFANTLIHFVIQKRVPPPQGAMTLLLCRLSGLIIVGMIYWTKGGIERRFPTF